VIQKQQHRLLVPSWDRLEMKLTGAKKKNRDKNKGEKGGKRKGNKKTNKKKREKTIEKLKHTKDEKGE
jgi:hypothetical protein